MSLVKHSVRWTWRATVISLLLLALSLSALRIVVPGIDQWRYDLEVLASEAVGQPVRLGSIKARLSGLRPRIEARDVEILDATGQFVALRASALRTELDLLGSLRRLQLQTGLIEIIGAQFSVQRLQDGRVIVSGVGTPERSDAGALDAWLFAQPRLRLVETDIYWQDWLLDDRTMFFGDVSVDLENAADRHQLAADLTLPPPWGGPLSVRIDMRGSIGEPKGRRTDIYFHTEGLSLPQLLAELLASPVEITAGDVDLSLWTEWVDGRMTEASGFVDIDEWPVRERPGQAPRVGYKGKLRLRVGSNDWRADMVELDRPADALNGAAHYSWNQKAQKARLRIAADALPIGLLREVAPSVLPSGASAALADFRAGGQVRQLQMLIEARSAVDIDWGLTAKLRDVHAPAVDHIPGFSGLGGQIWVAPEGGRLELAQQPMHLSMPELFEQPLSIAPRQAQLLWRQVSDGSLVLSGPDMQVDVNGVPARARLFLAWPEKKAAEMDLQAELDPFDATAIDTLLPRKKLPPKLSQWLIRGIEQGRAHDAAMLWRGPLRGFPFADAQGRFLAGGRVEGLTLNYRPGWPAVKQGRATLRFADNSMAIDLEKGQIGRHALRSASARVAQLKPATPLFITGQADGSLESGMAFLAASPLAEQVPRELQAAATGGRADVSINLEIPLRGKDPVKVAGVAALSDAGLSLATTGIEVAQLKGKLTFTRQKIAAESLRGRWQGLPIDAQFSHPFIAGTPFDLALSGTASATQLAGLLGPVSRVLDGQAQWRGRLRVPVDSGADGAQLDFESNLLGLAVNAPDPLGKQNNEVLALSGQLRPADNRSRLLRIRYAGLGEYLGELVPSETGVEMLVQHFRFGGSPVPSTRTGLNIDGELGQLDLDDWAGFVTALNGRSEGAERRSPISVDLHLGALTWLGERFADVDVNAQDDGQRFDVDVAAPRVKGRISQDYRGGLNGPLQLALQKLDLAIPELGEPGQKSSEFADFLPSSLPPLEVDVASLSMAGRELGQLSVRSLPTSSGLQIARATLVGDGVDAKATGSWDLIDGQPQTRLSLAVQTQDMGHLLDRVGFERAVARGGGQLTLEGTAAVALPDLHLADFDGELSIMLEQGALPNIKPGVGRVFGLLDLGSIQRRLSLDFRDVVDKGMAFDSITGRFSLSDGNAYTDDLRLRGPSADIDISGRIGLAARDYEQQVLVKPNLGASLPIAGTVVGGPAVGAAVLLVQELIGSPVDALGKVKYEVTGPWDDPQVARTDAERKVIEVSDDDFDG